MPERNQSVKLAITSGDPCGIGPEVALKALHQLKGFPLIPILITNRQSLEKNYQELLKPFTVRPFDGSADEQGVLYILDHNPAAVHFIPGAGSVESARDSLAYIDAGITLWQSGQAQALVTGPVHKGLVEKGGVKFMGHTEYIAAKIGEPEPYMMMYSETNRVILVTTHIPVAKLPEHVTYEKILGTIRTAHTALSKSLGRAPRIAVAGLDPHCGDDGAIGSFDADTTRRAVEAAKSEGIDASGPLPADTLFLKNRWSSFDIAVAMYHDQGLIPFKMTAFENGVNVTLGLSIVRTSVDHGTAFDIAGKGIAGHTSMVEALKLACSLAG